MPKRHMPSKQSIAEALIKLLDTSDRPLYVVDAQRRIAFCNAALATWIDLEPKRTIGRRVEFHSEPAKTEELIDTDSSPLTDLCPPPSALAGEASSGTISCLGRDGHLHHRTADFIPVGRAGQRGKAHDAAMAEFFTVLVLLGTEDLSPQQLAISSSGDPTADEIHRTIRRFRRRQAERYSLRSLLGASPAMQKVRAQVAAAAASGASTLITGRSGSGRSHVARAIHYHAAGDHSAHLAAIDCSAVTDDLLERTLDRLRPAHGEAASRPTLILEHLEALQPEHQAALLSALEQNALAARIIATLDPAPPPPEKSTDRRTSGRESPSKSKRKTKSRGDASTKIEFHELPSDSLDMPDDTAATRTLQPQLLSRLSTIVIRIPPLVDRIEDLPIVAQYFLEACNRASSKQVGSLRSDALDLLALYSWPGELEQVRETIEAAHAACTSHAIAAADLPPIFSHAFRAASRIRPRPEPIVLDKLLASIETEAITRALAQADGNKSEAATLLGMTRPRLYRRLLQLGMITPEAADDAGAEAGAEAPEFIEHDGDGTDEAEA
ncbi:MAG: sigma 54-interacting transcriptional regulator [Pirellulales bacterium]